MRALAHRQVLRVWHSSRSQRVRTLHWTCSCAAHCCCLLCWLVRAGWKNVHLGRCCGACTDGLCAFSCSVLHRRPCYAAHASFGLALAGASLAHAMSWSGCRRSAHDVLASGFQPLSRRSSLCRPVRQLRAAEGFWFCWALAWLLCSRGRRRRNSALSRV